MIFIITLFWASPPPLGHPPVAGMLYYLFVIAEKFPAQVIQRHRNAFPPPMGGRAGARGVIITMKRGFPMKIALNKCEFGIFPTLN